MHLWLSNTEKKTIITFLIIKFYSLKGDRDFNNFFELCLYIKTNILHHCIDKYTSTSNYLI